jgi:hypothetical protein
MHTNIEAVFFNMRYLAWSVPTMEDTTLHIEYYEVAFKVFKVTVTPQSILIQYPFKTRQEIT